MKRLKKHLLIISLTLILVFTATSSYATHKGVPHGGGGGGGVDDGDWTISGNNMSSTVIGNVGIGEQAPVSRLEINGTTNDASEASLDVQNNLDNSLLFVRNDGNVGIGTTNPQSKLDVAGTIRAQGFEGLNNQPVQFTDGIKVGTDTITIEGAQPPNDINRITFTNAPGIIQTDGNPLTIDAGAGDLILNSTSTGNVGIGTDTPNAKLHVDGEVRSVVNGVDFFMVPRGGIIMWSGPISDIPTPEWQLCDGTNGTPNLTDMFIVGAGSSYNVNDTGGSDSHGHSGDTGAHTLTVNEMPSHTHAQDPLTAIHRTTHGGMFGSTTGGVGGTTQSTGGGQGHTHPISGTNSNTDSLPPFLALAYIMRL